MTATRVVSLVPSVTETLLAWGVEPIACTRFCEQPGLRHVGGTKDPDLGAIVDLEPDVVVVDEEENRKQDADALATAGVNVHATAVRSVGDVGPALVALAATVGLSAAVARIEFGPSPGRTRKRAFVPIWKRPWMTINGDTYGSSLLSLIGVANVYEESDARYPECTIEDARRRAPDLVVAASEPYPFAERHRAELSGAAVDVRFVDGRDLFWWGARTPSAAGRLSLVLR